MTEKLNLKRNLNFNQTKESYKMNPNQLSIAMFIDFENLALGFKTQGRFEVQFVLKRLLEKGKIVAKKAYCDWSRFGQYTASLHEAAIELIEIPKRGQTGKNSADIRLCVDAMDLAYSKDHIDTFVIVSGDSDFSPLVSKLKELGKHVIGVGMTESTSHLLRDNCDEFIYYEDLVLAPSGTPIAVKGDAKENKKKAFSFLFEGLHALRRDNREVLVSSLIKSTIKRMHPSFDEGHFGYRNWGSLLVDAEKEGLIELTNDPRSGTFVVVRFGDEMKTIPKSVSVSSLDALNSTQGVDRSKEILVKAAAVAEQTTGPKPAAAAQKAPPRRPRSPVVRRKTEK